MGFGLAKTFDVEVWLPGQNAYKEISSCSNYVADSGARGSKRKIRRLSGMRGLIARPSNQIIEPLRGRIVGRVALEDQRDYEGNVVVSLNQEIGEDLATPIQHSARPRRRHNLAAHYKTNPIRAACESGRSAVTEASPRQNTAIPVYLSRRQTRHHHSLKTRHARPLAAVCLAFLGNCTKAPDPAPPDAKATDARVIVAVAKVAPTDLEKHEVMAAEFRPFQIIDVHARIAGYLKKIYVDVGDRVKEGQDLALLEVPELVDELSHAQASRSRSVAEVNRAKEDVARAQAQYQAAHLIYDRLAGVAKTRPTLIAQQEIDDAQAKDLAAQAAVSAANAALAAAQQTVDVSQSDIEKVKTMTSFTKITAPFTGVVTKRYADTGAMIPAGTASTSNGLALVQLSQNNLLRLVLPVPEALVAKIKLGSAVKVHVGALNRDFDGKVSRFSDSVSMATRTMDTEIDVPNPSLILIPGMYAEATITVEQRPHALAIPLEAVTQTSKGATAYVVDSGGHIAIRNLRLGLETPDRVEVLSGLEAGELVVVGNRSSLVAGQAVVAKIAEAKVM
jgi:RND family efflux transporter MFP subunit